VPLKAWEPGWEALCRDRLELKHKTA
jgi:hypothetical protein